MSHASRRAAAMRLSSVTAVTSQETLPYAAGQSQCVTDYWKTPSHTAASGSDTLDTYLSTVFFHSMVVLLVMLFCS